MTNENRGAAHGCSTSYRLILAVVEIVGIYPLDFDGSFDANADAILNHQSRQVLAIDENNLLRNPVCILDGALT